MKIAIDIDDTVVDVASQILWRVNNQHGSNFKLEEITSWERWGKYEGFTPEDFYKEMDYLNYKTMQVEFSAPEVVMQLNSQENFIIFQTACIKPEHFEQKARFIAEMFGEEYPILYFTHTDCKRFPGFDVLIDDSPVVAVNNIGEVLKILLFDKPWNQKVGEGRHFTTDVIRVHNWDEIFNLLRREL